MFLEQWMKWSLVVLFLFLVVSMFFNRIFPRRGFTFSLRFIGVQIGLSVLVVFLHGSLVWGSRQALLFIGISMGISLLAEWFGVRKGWIFGRYRYTKKSGPRWFGQIPIFVPFMWCVITYMGFWTAKLLLFPLSGRNPFGHAVFILTASFLVTVWDLVADPLVVHEGAWLWEKRGRYYGVPVTNFIGWFLTSVLIFTAFVLLADKPMPVSRPPGLIFYLPSLGYCILTGVFSRACFERRLVVPGIIGLITTVFCLLVTSVARYLL